MQRKAQRGFTFIELMITLSILATLAMVAAPMAQVALQREKEHQLRAALIEIREAIDAYKRAADNGRIKLAMGDSGYPKKLEDLVVGVPDQRSPRKQNMYFLRRIPRDPFAPVDGNANGFASSTTSGGWAVRSYASPPDNPTEGEDVFDVSSRSAVMGLNGIPLKQW
ncbi:prepilin-type N-terminal cleavage/methylation domain-containing protein [Rugamonas sp. FT107W]|uniref:Prepilin-type N-terminal cleavage/methylation domain-containing protein n=1 Tax=Duganella vulcania TaxID=2692166 RepID=A0A845HID9_9BURK|nr:type II secretion system protein [Duganella vulcania]MYN17335.1 prepilin-type N-terminal cleavage/methylation domain-containing protein [Duganella vulcania]